MEVVEKLTTENPKLLPGEYGDLVRALKKVGTQSGITPNVPPHI